MAFVSIERSRGYARVACVFLWRAGGVLYASADTESLVLGLGGAVCNICPKSGLVSRFGIVVGLLLSVLVYVIAWRILRWKLSILGNWLVRLRRHFPGIQRYFWNDHLVLGTGKNGFPEQIC